MRSLLMGGQACVLYGGAEFSRDTDIVVLADAENLRRLQAAIEELEAEPIAVPPFEQRFLEAGHAVHFRCQDAESKGMRLDVMAKIRGLPDFDVIWDRRTTIETDQLIIDVLSLPDLVTAKKTQRDKDWPMIARLVEAHYARHAAAPEPAMLDFWLREARTPQILIDVARLAPDHCQALAVSRPLLTLAADGDEASLVQSLRVEQDTEREADRRYWAPLKRELEQLRSRRTRPETDDR